MGGWVGEWVDGWEEEGAAARVGVGWVAQTLLVIAAVFSMTSVNNSNLRSLWLVAPHGRLSPWQQARALALRKASRELTRGGLLVTAKLTSLQHDPFESFVTSRSCTCR